MSNNPRDKPSFCFTTDVYLKDIYKVEQFGVVLVAAWPPNQSLLEPYHEFISKVKQCFDDSDLSCENDSSLNHDDTIISKTPNVYLYPPQHLHITIATFHPFTSRSADTRNQSQLAQQDHDDERYTKLCTKVVENALKRDEWPKKNINLEIDGTQIGEKAGILLWKGCTENDQESFSRMRTIVTEEYDKAMGESEISNEHSLQKVKRQLQVPNIIHSTFLRFHSLPLTDGRIIQERFQTLVKDNINVIFKNQLSVDSIKLVVEKRAYMHIPCDDEHILASIDLG